MARKRTNRGQATAPSAHEVLLHVRRALAHLYNPVYLQRSPLVRWLHLHEGEQIPAGQEAKTLRRVLLETVDQLQPGPNVPLRSPERRGYAVLRGRYVDGVSMDELAATLGLSTRQLRRELLSAIEALSDILRRRYLADQGQPPTLNGPDESVLREIESLEPEDDPVNLCAEVRAARPLVEPLSVELGTRLVEDEMPTSLMVRCDRILLRQALLSAYSWAVQAHPGASVRAKVSSEGAWAVLTLRCTPCAGDPAHESIEAAPPALLQALRAEQTWRPIQGGCQLALRLPAMPMRRVLLIDDNRSLHQLFRRYLSGLPYQVLSAYDGPSGLALVRSEQPEVIVLDIMIPSQDGWELLRALKEDPATQRIPIVVCSVLEQDALARSLLAQAYLRKPVTQDALIATLRSLRP